MCSSVKSRPHRVCFALGSFDGEHFVFENENEEERFFAIERGPDFYAPQSFLTPDGRRVVIAWMYNWSRKEGAGRTQVGSFTIPRELRFNDEGKLTMMPIKEMLPFVVKESPYVSYDNGLLRIRNEAKTMYTAALACEPEMIVLHDVEACEVFLDGGTTNITTFI